ncbi:MAG TPA: biotin--[acetyl-CoA-carboxylase] ligase [Gammaproteobacteria bacterium]
MKELAREALLAALADGRARSGEELARAFGVSRAAVWKHVRKLEDWQVEVRGAPGHGYRLERPIDLLDREALAAALARRLEGAVRLEVHTELASTNARLLDAPPPPGVSSACLAEYQTAGRGRRGRRWRTPLGAGLCLSVGWQFERTPPDLPALTLAAGVTTRRVLAAEAGVDAALKWPNDLVWDERKLGGILVEMTAEAQGACHVVIGVGINVAMPPALLAAVSDWPRGAVDLATATGGSPPSRTALAAALVEALHRLCAGYAASGFAPYLDGWREADYLRGRRVAIDEPRAPVTGVALGIDASGALLVETDAGERRRVIAGDVSVRGA